MIELLVVIAIIAILAAMVLPALSSAKSCGRSASCKNHLRQMGIALKMYLDDNQGRYPYFGWYPNQTLASWFPWPEFLRPYYPISWTNRNYHCPGYGFAIREGLEPGDQSPALFGSYGYNCQGTVGYGKLYQPPTLGVGEGAGDYDGSNPHIARYPPPIQEWQVKAPSEMLALGDSRLRKIPPFPIFGDSNLWCGDPTARFGIPPDYFPSIPRHGRGLNYLFCDGRVAALHATIVLNPTNSAPLWNRDHETHPETW